MGQRRIDAIRAAYAAFDRGEFEFVAGGYHDDAVFDLHETDFLSGILTGKASFQGAWTREQEAWAAFTQAIDEITELDRDRVLVGVTQHARGAGSGVELTRRVWMIYEYRGNKVACACSFADREAALATTQASRAETGP